MQVSFTVIAAFALCLGISVFAVPLTSTQGLNGQQTSILGSIFNISALPGYVNIPAKATGPQGACYAAYAADAYQISVVGGAELRFCVQATVLDLNEFFALNSAEDFNARLTSDVQQCSGLLKCQSQAIVAAAAKVSSTAQSPDVSACVEKELSEITAQLNTASDKLTICLTLAAV